jgi:polysaccharide export outer membrane protein
MKRSTKLAALALALSVVLTSGCSTLPQAGPSARRVYSDRKAGEFAVREVDRVEALPAAPDVPDFTPFPIGLKSGIPMLVAGDAISVVFYEVGARLFSTPPTTSGSYDANAKATTIGPVSIDQDGMIRLPYTGEIQATGLTPRQLATAIEARLRGKSENPQVIVRVDSANGSSVMVSGEIARTGRVPLTSAQERLLDVISLAGGPRGAPETLLVRVDREGLLSEGPLEKLTYENFGGTVMQAGDRVLLVRQPWTYTVLGSANRINRFDLPLRRLSLVEALALAGGPSEYTANPGAVFVFRYGKEKTAELPLGAERPIVYHVNMLKPTSYLLAQRFYLTDKDVVYVAGAEANLPSKLLQIIGQIVGPVAVARQITN